MSAKFKRFPPLFVPGASWFEDVPKSWAVKRLRHVLRRRTERNQPELPLLSVIRDKGVIVRDITSLDENHNYIPDDLSNYKVVRTGQFAMNKMKAWQGSYGVSWHDGIVSPAYFVFDVFGVDVSFFHVAIRSLAYVPAFTRASDGVRIGQWDLVEARMREIPFLVPPSVAQRGIVRFLDHANRRIQRYMRAKQKMIALLEEQKQAIIHQAVTGQIDVRTGQPYPDYKTSGVDWLGEIPAHWNLFSLKRVSSRWQNGATPPTSEVTFYENGTVPWYGPSSCGTKEEVTSPVRHLSRAAFSSGGARLIQGPALLIVVIGATAGRMTLMPNEGSTNQQITAFEISPDRVIPRFILRQVRGAESWLRSTASSATIPILDSRVVGRLLCAVPPLVEQKIINRAIDYDVARIDQLVERTLDEISQFREYRIRLIADVVTGRLDVREAVAGLTKPDSLGAEDDAADCVNHADRSETTGS